MGASSRWWTSLYCSEISGRYTVYHIPHFTNITPEGQRFFPFHTSKILGSNVIKRWKIWKIYIISIKLELLVLISGEIVFTKVITWRRNNDFHFSPKGKNGAQNAICPSGVKKCMFFANSLIHSFLRLLMKCVLFRVGDSHVVNTAEHEILTEHVLED